MGFVFLKLRYFVFYFRRVFGRFEREVEGENGGVFWKILVYCYILVERR